MKHKIFDLLGWYGVIAILFAYGLISFSILQSTSLVYQLLNLTGAICIAVISLYEKSYQPGILNIIWALIAMFALIKVIVR